MRGTVCDVRCLRARAQVGKPFHLPVAVSRYGSRRTAVRSGGLSGIAAHGFVACEQAEHAPRRVSAACEASAGGESDKPATQGKRKRVNCGVFIVYVAARVALARSRCTRFQGVADPSPLLPPPPPPLHAHRPPAPDPSPPAHTHSHRRGGADWIPRPPRLDSWITACVMWLSEAGGRG